MSLKLNHANLSQFGSRVAVPQYDRSRIRTGIAHIGVGGFHRSHQAVYGEDLFQLGEDLQWGICGLGLLPHDARMRDVLQAQNNLYTLVERGADQERARVVGSIVDFVFAPADRETAMERLAAEETRIVSLTITEGGYYLTGKGGFDADHPEIRRELENPSQPTCWPGYLVEALDRRRRRELRPFTVMSCDNIQGNGDVAKRVLIAFAELRDPKLARWIEANGAFPNSMVDRITPATTDELRKRVRETYGIDDEWPVMAEPFRQWVIEDHFALGRPAWEKAGAQLIGDVLPYETMKLRLLNASHQALCYIGMLLGYEFVHQTMQDADIRRLVETMMDTEITPVLPAVPGVDLATYKRTLIDRFANPAIRDQLSRIGIYGSSGLPKFLLPTIEEQLRRGGGISGLSLVVASWFRYLNGRDERGRDIAFRDPMGPKLKQIAAVSGTDPTPLLAQRDIFREELANSPEFVGTVSRFLRSFYEIGTRATLRMALEAVPDGG